MSSAPAVMDGVHTARAGGLPSWLRIALVLFAAVAAFDDLHLLEWSALPPTAAALVSAWIVLSYGAVALLAWSAAASARSASRAPSSRCSSCSWPTRAAC